MKVKTQSKKVNKAWLNDHVNDPYVKLAQKDGYRARAAYKLKEIDEHFSLIQPDSLVIDLGSAPGAWSQYIRRKLSPQGAATGQLHGVILAVDLLPMEPIEGVVFFLGDFHNPDVLQSIKTEMRSKKADLVVSDMAPNLSGISSVDGARVAGLIELAVEFCRDHLKSDGVLVAKVFHGGGYNEAVHAFKTVFKVVKPYKPKASRDRSAETFLIGSGLKPEFVT